MNVCRIGIIGAGRIGKIHAENICRHLPSFQLIGIADPYIDLNWAQSLNIALFTSDVEEIIHHPNIDAVLIASPSTLHVQQIIAASRAKKAIFCEKPIGLSEAEIHSCLQVIQSQNSLLQIGFNRRFDPNFANICTRVQEGEIGRPQLIRITSRDPACPSKEYIKTSGGIFMDMTIHDFDMARFLCGSEIVEVYAAGANLIRPDFAEYHDVDTAIIQLCFANGALGVIDNSRQAVYGYDQRAEVFGSKGMLLAHNQSQHTVECWNEQDKRAAIPPYFFLQRYQASYIAELQAFYQAWAHAQPSPVNGYDGLQALRVACAAQQSLVAHQPVAVWQENQSHISHEQQYE
ncbi:MAG: inositol 2-dehydrogenase [Gammaproteobacteria bacterium RIFCSPHIGHO2_12_FULL_37_34]|nr:MAG: inositol 2-dehydrogenase [Gammaproteobacteria bacterium RIFCSPHIGHO2_12_FULL_37_34]